VYSVIDKRRETELGIPSFSSRGENNDSQDTLVYTGPTPLLPAAQFAMAAADIHHRTPEFRALFQKVLGQLKVFVGTQNDVLLLSSSGTGAMEASVSNLTSAGDRVLVLTAASLASAWVGPRQGLRLCGGCGWRSLTGRPSRSPR